MSYQRLTEGPERLLLGQSNRGEGGEDRTKESSRARRGLVRRKRATEKPMEGPTTIVWLGSLGFQKRASRRDGMLIWLFLFGCKGGFRWADLLCKPPCTAVVKSPSSSCEGRDGKPSEGELRCLAASSSAFSFHSLKSPPKPNMLGPG